jgi:hypothetical protein
LTCINVQARQSWPELAKCKQEEDPTMAERASEKTAWSTGWGVVMHVHEKLEFVAFFDTRKDAEAAAAAAGIDHQVCWLTYRYGLNSPLEEHRNE